MNALLKLAALLAVLLLMLPICAVTGLWRILSSSSAVGGLLTHIGVCGAAILLAFVLMRAAAGLRAMKRGEPVDDEKLIALSLLAGLLSAAFGGARPLGIGAGAVCAALFCMLAAGGAKGLSGVACAAMVASLRTLGTNGELTFIAVLCSCTLIACLSVRFGKLGTALGFALPAAAFALLIHGSGALKLSEILLSAALFMIIPRGKPASNARERVSQRETKLERLLLYRNYKLIALSEVLHEMASLFGGRETEADGFISSQLSGVAQSLSRLSSFDGGDERRRFSVRLGSAGMTKNGSEQTGDSCLIRQFEGMSLAAISDGMGSGGAARRESEQTVQLLADLVTCGFRIDEAADCVNRLLLLREGGEMYATLDAMIFDPMSGRLCVAKQGAPASYVLRSGKLDALYAEALPIGILEEAETAVFDTKMKRGDFIVMMSDGVSDALGDALYDAVSASARESDPRLAAKALVDYAARLGGGDDDMTAIVAMVG